VIKRGMTLVELLIAVAILSAVMLSVGSVLMSTAGELSVSMADTDLRTKMNLASEKIVDELSDASLVQTTVAADGHWVSYAVPVQLDLSYTGASPDFQQRYGARAGANETVGGLNAIVFQESANPAVSPISEATAVPGGININANTEAADDFTDTYRVGRLVHVYDPNGTFPNSNNQQVFRAITGEIICQASATGGTGLGSDIDGDGNNDPIFQLNNNSVIVNLWALRLVRSENTPLLVNDRVTVQIGNP